MWAYLLDFTPNKQHEMWALLLYARLNTFVKQQADLLEFTQTCKIRRKKQKCTQRLLTIHSGNHMQQTNKRICIVHVMHVVHRKPCFHLYIGRKMHVFQGHDNLLLRDSCTQYQKMVNGGIDFLSTTNYFLFCTVSNLQDMHSLCLFKHLQF